EGLRGLDLPRRQPARGAADRAGGGAGVPVRGAGRDGGARGGARDRRRRRLARGRGGPSPAHQRRLLDRARGDLCAGARPRQAAVRGGRVERGPSPLLRRTVRRARASPRLAPAAGGSLLGLGDPDTRQRAAALQPDELPQRLDLAARQRADRRGPASVRARRRRARCPHRARRGLAPLRRPPAARAVLRLRSPARKRPGAVSGRVSTAGVGGGERVSAARSLARHGARCAAPPCRLSPAAAPALAPVARNPQPANRGCPRGSERVTREVRRLDRDRAQGGRGRHRRNAMIMRIAIISTAAAAVPPVGYGGTERVVHYLTEGLVRAGHEVTLFATGDSRTAADLRWLYRESVWPIEAMAELNHVAWSCAEIAADAFDVVHANQAAALALSRFVRAPLVYTLHHDRVDELSRFY